MVRSMTGYGSAAYEGEDFSLRATVSSGNHRFLEIHIRLPEALGAWEPVLRKKIQERFERGRIVFALEFMPATPVWLTYEVNRPLVMAYVTALRQIRDEFGLSGEVDINALLQVRDLLRPRPLVEIPPTLAEKLETVTEDALRALAEMRAAEGAHLRQDLLARLALIAEHLHAIEREAAALPELYRQRLTERWNEWARELPLDPTRVMQEILHFVNRADISEEITRLRSHLAQCRDLLDEGTAVGKRLDFLFQEMHREINTILAKAGNVALAERALAIKVEIEKLREQVQNVE
ncbi:MAG: YicC family protein [Blastocatellia bacterium]|nr:YicC family protein [Blastocatellia bacterium]MCS7156832.1 YicC family protein [Blastocatellia bacterium]MCX7752790.1 YicC family protein [Blastocatellia bacterium]MDW8167523.1 YicC/YloC family endoribonuclease [Acidobacteriota bacterium]MDW8256870.1 YicC/YloC family endoribonuclease [Acidobacteriota bacterium]